MRKFVTGTLFNKISYDITMFAGVSENKGTSLGVLLETDDKVVMFHIAAIFAYISADFYPIKGD